ncbi:MAG: energy transducer TonB [Terracidiphilus sp.]
MRTIIDTLRGLPSLLKPFRLALTACGIGFLCMTALGVPGRGQAAAPPPDSPPAQTSQAPAAMAQPAASGQPGVQAHQPAGAEKDPTLSQGAFTVQTVGGEIKEDQIKQLLVGKTLYLRSGYQDNNLEFDERGRLLGHSPRGSYTLSQIQINKVKLSKHKLELDGDRYALHFLGAAPFEDPTATDRVKITPKKKTVRISFDREQVETPKKKKDKRKHKDQDQAKAATAVATVRVNSDAAQGNATASVDPAATQNLANGHHSDDKKVTTTTSAAHASQLLLAALDNVFSSGIDARMIAAMPDFWKLYYQAAESKTDYKPTDPGVFRQSAVDQKAKLISAIDPPSNEFAQANGVAGMALYHAVIGSDGKVEEVVAARPIGFGLDESAEQTIRKASFQPAVKNGKPVPVSLDVVVSFRIYSKRTSQTGTQQTSVKADAPVLPGPYTVQTQTAAQATTAQ